MKHNQLLLEYDKTKTLFNYKDRLISIVKQDTIFYRNHKKIIDSEPADVAAEIILNSLEQIDPTKNKQYMMWIINKYLKREFRIEDTDNIRNTLIEFINLKTQIKRLGHSVDINQYTLFQLVELIDSFVTKDVDIDTTVLLSDEVKTLYSGPYGELFVPLTEQASCILGKGTRWCTSSTNGNNMFNDYVLSGPLFIWRDKTGKKYQFQIESGQFVNDQDTQISLNELLYFRLKHPILSKLFLKLESKMLSEYKANEKESRDIVKYIENFIKDRWIEFETILFSTDDVTAQLDYIQILNTRNIDIESYISNNPELIIAYTNKVIKARWLEKEHIIFNTQDPYLVIEYCNASKSLIDEAEKIVLDNGYSTDIYNYALLVKSIDKKVWLAGKKKLEKFNDKIDPSYGHIMKRFWENVINTIPNKNNIFIRWLEYEKVMIRLGLYTDAIRYSEYINERLPALESILFNNASSRTMDYYQKHFCGKNIRILSFENALETIYKQFPNMNSIYLSLRYLRILNSKLSNLVDELNPDHMIDDTIRVPEIEKIVFTNPKYTYEYVVGILNRRIPSLEPMIYKEKNIAQLYVDWFGIDMNELNRN